MVGAMAAREEQGRLFADEDVGGDSRVVINARCRLQTQDGYRVAEAARRAGVSRATLFRLIRRHGIKSEES